MKDPQEMKLSTKDPKASDAPSGAPSKADKPDEPERLTPDGWAKRLGGIDTLKLPRGEQYFVDYRHPMARNIHGWAAHAYHEQSTPFLLTYDDYAAALKVAESPPPYRPHKPALTKYAAPEYVKAAK